MIFFPIVLAVYFFIPKKLRTVWLLAASYYFYMSWNAMYIILIGLSTVATYLSAILFERFNGEGTEKGIKKKKITMVFCIVLNLGILGFYKYGNFFLDTINGILGVFRLSLGVKHFDILLPVGISFYTFQALGYMIDVYRGDVKVEKNFVKYALFVSFFPQLVAGPIERSKTLLKQINDIPNLKLWNAQRITRGAIMMVWGLFLKMVLADRLAIFVDTICGNYRMYGSIELVLALYAFLLQVYCDFYSYSVIATGAAGIMGIELMENFNAPLFSRTIKEYWARWHISLGTWFRDYLYIPLGGSRKGKTRKYINLMIVFLLCGLWHGVGWNYVIWGGLHGAYQVVGEMTYPYRKKIREKFRIKTDCFSRFLLECAVTYSLVSLNGAFFKTKTVREALVFLKRILVKPDLWILFDGGIYRLGLNRSEMNILVFGLMILLFVGIVRYKCNETIDVFLLKQNIWFEWLFIIGMIFMIFAFGEYGPKFDPQQYVYFQF